MSSSRPNIWICEDDKVLGDLAATFLALEGYDVVEISRDMEAARGFLKRLHDKSVSILAVILDGNLGSGRDFSDAREIATGIHGLDHSSRPVIIGFSGDYLSYHGIPVEVDLTKRPNALGEAILKACEVRLQTSAA